MSDNNGVRGLQTQIPKHPIVYWIPPPPPPPPPPHTHTHTHTLYHRMDGYLTAVEVRRWINNYIGQFYVHVIIHPCHKINVGLASLLVNEVPDSRDVSLAAQWIPLNADWIHHCSLGPLWTQVLRCHHRDVWQCRPDYHMTVWHLFFKRKERKLDESLMIYHMLLRYKY